MRKGSFRLGPAGGRGLPPPMTSLPPAEAPAANAPPRRGEAAFLALSAAFVAGSALLINSDWFHERIGYWHWWRYDLEPNWSPLLLGAAAALGLAVRLGRTRPAAGLAFASIAFAFGLHLFMGRVFPMQMLTHYVTESVNPSLGIRSALRDYEQAVALAFHPLFLDTKPPGRLLAFLAPTRLVSLATGNVVDQWFGSAAFWWVLSHAAGFAVIALLHRHLREERGARAALFGAGLWAFAPSVVLLEMEFDTRFYPLAALGLWLLFRRADLGWRGALGGGAVFAAASYTGFSMALLAVIPGVFLAARARQDWRGALKLGLLFAAPTVALHAALWLAFGYDPAARLDAALAAHAREFGMDRMGRGMKALLVLQGVGELAVSIGVLAIAAAWGIAKHGRLEGGRPKAETIAMLAYIAVLPLSGGVVSESARLWASMTPFLAILAARAAPSERAAWAAIAIQIAFVLSCLPNQMFTYGRTM